jgi:hypothetical protein
MTSLEDLRSQVQQHLLTLNKEQLEEVLRKKHIPRFELLPCLVLGKSFYLYDGEEGKFKVWKGKDLLVIGSSKDKQEVIAIFPSCLRDEYLVFASASINVINLREKDKKVKVCPIAAIGCQKALSISPGKFLLEMSDSLAVVKIGDKNSFASIETFLRVKDEIKDFGIFVVLGRSYVAVLSSKLIVFDLTTFETISETDFVLFEHSHMDETGVFIGQKYEDLFRFHFKAEEKSGKLGLILTPMIEKILDKVQNFSVTDKFIFVIDEPVSAEKGRLVSTEKYKVVQKIPFLRDSVECEFLSESFIVTSGEYMSAIWRLEGDEVFVFQEFSEVISDSFSFPPPTFIKKPYIDFLEQNSKAPREVLGIIADFCVVQ